MLSSTSAWPAPPPVTVTAGAPAPPSMVTDPMPLRVMPLETVTFSWNVDWMPPLIRTVSPLAAAFTAAWMVEKVCTRLPPWNSCTGWVRSRLTSPNCSTSTPDSVSWPSSTAPLLTPVSVTSVKAVTKPFGSVVAPIV